MPTYKLSYFDIDGGRAEHIRIAFHAAGIEFEDHRIGFPEFAELRSKIRFNAVPVLEIDGAQVTQSNAMSRFVAKQANLYPADDLQALYCDEVLGAMEDLTWHVTKSFGLEGDALKSAREELLAGPATTFFRGLDELLTRGGGTYFVNDQLSIADIKVYIQVTWFTNGSLDHIPTDFITNLAPRLMEHHQRIENEDIVKAYYASRA